MCIFVQTESLVDWPTVIWSSPSPFTYGFINQKILLFKLMARCYQGLIEPQHVTHILTRSNVNCKIQMQLLDILLLDKSEIELGKCDGMWV